MSEANSVVLYVEGIESCLIRRKNARGNFFSPVSMLWSFRSMKARLIHLYTDELRMSEANRIWL
jgi:hypothetical protein